MCGVFGIRAPDATSRASPSSASSPSSTAARSPPASPSPTATASPSARMGLVAQVFDEQNLSGLPATSRSATRATRRPARRTGRTRSRSSSTGARTVALGHNGNLTNAGSCATSSRRTASAPHDLRHRGDRRADRERPGAARGGGRERDGTASRAPSRSSRSPRGSSRLPRPARLPAALLGRHRRRLGPRLRDLRPRPRRRRVRARGRARRARRDRQDGVRSSQAVPKKRRRALRLRVHLLRPARHDASRASGARGPYAHGRAARRGAPVEADLVIPVPDSARPAAIGFARASGIPFCEGLIKNRYVGRTFIQPDQGIREQGIRLKFNPLDEVAGKRVVVVDDSIVRGNTTRKIVAHAPRRRRARGPRAHLVAADRLALLLRDRLRRRGAARRLDRRSRRSASRSARPRSRTSRSKASRRRRPAASEFCRACFTREYPTGSRRTRRSQSFGSSLVRA